MFAFLEILEETSANFRKEHTSYQKQEHDFLGMHHTGKLEYFQRGWFAIFDEGSLRKEYLFKFSVSLLDEK